MVSAAGGGLIIAAGGGVTEDNAAALVVATGVGELHGSLRGVVSSAMSHRPAVPIYMGSEKHDGQGTEFETKQTDGGRVAAVLRALASVESGDDCPPRV
mmetsp:Transcript_52598/g.112529  ORF Transcript_52598/g.112529 Transcript_52598/m.112529 type:complete len:99 (+) Transcript_52598:1-297(+)